MHQNFFETHHGHLHAKADKIARRHGGRHINVIDADRRYGWFQVPSTGFAIDDHRIKCINRDVAAAGGIDALLLKRDRA